MTQRTLYVLVALALAGMVLGVMLGVSGIDPASHWVFSASLLALLVLGVVWAIRAWRQREDRPLLGLMGLAAVGTAVGWIAGEAGATTIGAVVVLASMIALVTLLVVFVARRRRAVG